MSRYRAVLFDWVGTIVHEQTDRWRLRRTHEMLSRPIDESEFESIVANLEAAYLETDINEAMRTEDCSPRLHRTANMSWFERAGLDTDLAETLEAMDSDPDTHPIYPDAAAVLRMIHDRELGVAVVSDFHLDLRPEMARHRVDRFVDVLVLPSSRVFRSPTRGCSPSRSTCSR